MLKDSDAHFSDDHLNHAEGIQTVRSESFFLALVLIYYTVINVIVTTLRLGLRSTLIRHKNGFISVMIM